MIDPQGIVGEIDELIRTAPDPYYAWGLDQMAWLGQARSILSRPEVGLQMQAIIAADTALHNKSYETGKEQLIVLLHQARHSLKMNLVGPTNVAVGKGMVFDYFDSLRRFIEEAREDLFFVDPFLDASVVSRYLSCAADGVRVRLLGRERMTALTEAASLYSQQRNMTVDVRSGGNFHDRFLFVDQRRGFQSGASFKDGGFKTPTVLLEIGDLFQQVMDTYQSIWDANSPLLSCKAPQG